VPVRCEEVRALLPQYVDWGPRPAGDVELHLATCPECTAELNAYRQMLGSLASMRDVDEEVPAGFLERTLGVVRTAERSPFFIPVASVRAMTDRVRQSARERPATYALASLGALATIGAAIGIVMWRRANRGIGEPVAVPVTR
jgi:anti-sigma factor RsiW